jgi:hypothetical protein
MCYDRKFAADDWDTTSADFKKIETKVTNRKRHLAQSLAMIMNAQDAGGFHVSDQMSSFCSVSVAT